MFLINVNSFRDILVFCLFGFQKVFTIRFVCGPYKLLSLSSNTTAGGPFHSWSLKYVLRIFIQSF